MYSWPLDYPMKNTWFNLMFSWPLKKPMKTWLAESVREEKSERIT